MANRLQFENSNDIGVFSKLTNAYCLVSNAGSESFYSVFESELAPYIPVIHCSINGTRILGRVTAGNHNFTLSSNRKQERVTCTKQHNGRRTKTHSKFPTRQSRNQKN